MQLFLHRSIQKTSDQACLNSTHGSAQIQSRQDEDGYKNGYAAPVCADGRFDYQNPLTQIKATPDALFSSTRAG